MTTMRAAYACMEDDLLQDSQRVGPWRPWSIHELAFRITGKSNIVIVQVDSHATDGIEAGGIHLGEQVPHAQRRQEPMTCLDTHMVTPLGMIKREFLRYLNKTSKYEFYLGVI